MATLRSSGYNVIIGKSSLRSLSGFLSKKRYSSYFILCDEHTLQYCLPVLITSCPKLSSAEIIEIESGELSKSLEFSALIWQTLLENRADRNSLLVNLGGGVVTDLGGFTASLYKRGIDFINIPTSLLAMADASVGGKTGIDFNHIKNAIGSFVQPKAVFVNPAFLRTLPERHFQNGMAEIFKMALISSKSLWRLLKMSPLQKGADELVRLSIAHKNKIVAKDPYDKGLRKILNFGHTIGHAIESLRLGTKKELLHGEAIIIGMIVESHIAFQKRMISGPGLSEITMTLASRFTLERVDEFSADAVLGLIQNDKKTSGNKLRFSLLSGIGACKFDVPVSETQVKKALAYYNSLIQ